LVSENWSDCRFVWYQNFGSALFGFVTKHACVGPTDEQIDRQTDRITTLKTTLAYDVSQTLNVIKLNKKMISILMFSSRLC